MSETMTIKMLEVSNFKKLKNIKIEPEENTIIVAGNNGEGKSSLLDSIIYGLKGNKSLPEVPIRQGSTKSEIKLDLGDLLIERKITQKGSKLIVTNKDGIPQTTPQNLLDSLTGHISFDPLSFFRIDAKKQVEQIKNLLGLDFTELDTERAKAYKERTEKNITAKNFNALLDSKTFHSDVKQKINTDDINQDRNEAKAENEKRSQVIGLINSHDSKISSYENTIARNQEEIERLEKEIENYKSGMKFAESKIDAEKKYIQELTDQNPNLYTIDLSQFDEKINEANEHNLKVDQNVEYNDLKKKVNQAEKAAELLTETIKKIDSDKTDMIKNSNFPVAGMRFDDEGVYFNDLPVNQASQAERWKLGIALGLAFNPKIKIILIHDGSLLDDQSLATIEQLAKENDAQIWIERVGKDGKAKLILEDGEII